MKRAALLQALGPLIAVVLALVVGAGFIAAVGRDPFAVYGHMVLGVFGNAYGVGQVLFRATPLIFTGLAVALAFRAGLFNIGAEGQLVVGAFAAGVTGAALGSWPAPILLPLTLLSGMAAAALWALLPAILKAKVGAHEVINTIMMNFIALALVQYLGHFAFEHATVHTAEIGPGARIARFEQFFPVFRGSPLNLSLVIALVAAGVVGWLLWRTRFGYELRAVGLSPSAAEYAGIDVPKTWIVALCLSGALAGLVGANFVQGYKGYFESGFSAGIGFLGIAVALLGRNHPIGVVIASVFFAALGYGGLVINTEVPKELVEILQAIVILFAITLHVVFERMLPEARVNDGVLLTLAFVASTVRISVPYALAAVGGTMSERGGVINIALEGILLLGALGYVLGAHYSGNPWVGLLAAAATGLLTAALHAIVTVYFKADQITSSLGINLVAFGLTRFVLKSVFGSSSNSARVAGLPDIAPLAQVPGLGSLLGNPMVWISVILVVVAHVVLFRTPFGLRLRTVGEHPETAATLGLSVARLRTAGVLLSGVLAGLGGAWLAADQRSFTDGMSGGRGYIALAAMIVGKWSPKGAALACLLFGFCEALQIKLQGQAIPNEFLQMLPYAVTMIVLAGVIGRARPPAAVGVPYDAEHK